MTLRSNDQFNTEIYGYDDRLRDVSVTRNVLLMNPADIAQFDLEEGEQVGLSTAQTTGWSAKSTA